MWWVSIHKGLVSDYIQEEWPPRTQCTDRGRRFLWFLESRDLRRNLVVKGIQSLRLFLILLRVFHDSSVCTAYRDLGFTTPLYRRVTRVRGRTSRVWEEVRGSSPFGHPIGTCPTKGLCQSRSNVPQSVTTLPTATGGLQGSPVN